MKGGRAVLDIHGLSTKSLKNIGKELWLYVLSFPFMMGMPLFVDVL